MESPEDRRRRGDEADASIDEPSGANASAPETDEGGKGRITSVQMVGIQRMVDRRAGFDRADSEAQLRAHPMAARFRRLSAERREYLFNQIVGHHLAEGRVDQTRYLLSDLSFLTARLSFGVEGQLTLLLQDFHLALGWNELAGVRPISQALELSRYVLDSDPSQVVQQCLARLDRNDSAEVARLLDDARLLVRDLIPVRASLPSPVGALERSVAIPGKSLAAVVLLPDEKTCILADRSVLSLHSTESGEEIVELGDHGDEVTALVLLPNRGRAAVALREGEIQVWDWSTPCRVCSFALERATLALEVTPDGRLLSGGTDGSLRLWNLDSCTLERVLVEEGPAIEAIVCLGDGTVVTGGGNHFGDPREFDLRIWRLSDGELVHRFGRHEWPIDELAVTSDGKILVSAARQEIVVWDLDERRELHRMETERQIHGLRVIPRSRLAVTTDNPDLHLWDLDLGSRIRTLKGHHGLVRPPAVTEDGSRLVSVSEDQTLKIWNVERAQISEVLPHAAQISALLTLPGNRLASASADRTIGIWSDFGEHRIFEFQGHQHWVRDLAASFDGSELFSASWDGCVVCWDLATGLEKRRLSVPGLEGKEVAHLQAVAVSPFGRCVAGSFGGYLYCWQGGSSGAPWKCIETGKKGINALQFVTEKEVILATDRGVGIWDLETGERVLEQSFDNEEEVPPGLPEESAEVWRRQGAGAEALALAAGGREALIALRSGELLRWKLDDGEVLARWRACRCGITDVAFFPAGRWAATTSGWPTYASDNTLRIWDLQDRTCIARFVGETPMLSCSVSADGKRVVAGDAAGRIHVLSMEGSHEKYGLAGK